MDTIIISDLLDDNAIVNLNIGAVACAFLTTVITEEFSTVKVLRTGSSGGQGQENGKHSRFHVGRIR